MRKTAKSPITKKEQKIACDADVLVERMPPSVHRLFDGGSARVVKLTCTYGRSIYKNTNSVCGRPAVQFFVDDHEHAGKRWLHCRCKLHLDVLPGEISREEVEVWGVHES